MALRRDKKSNKRKGEQMPASFKNPTDDHITDSELAKQHAKTTLYRRKQGPSTKKMYNTARGQSVVWTPDDEERHEVRAFVRDTAALQASQKWEDLVGKGVTHLIIEDDANTLRTIPPEISNIQTLRSFMLMWSHVKIIPDHLLHMELRELCLHKCQLKNIDNIHLCRNLANLELVHNNLKKIPMEIGGMTSLVSIDLTGNHLKSLPVSIGNLERLKVLKVCGNVLTEIPTSFSTLQSLITLDASQNQIKDITQKFGRLTKLITLRLSHNQLAVLPTSFQKLEHLKYLYLGHNNFNEVPKLLGKLPKLQTLNMVSNHIIDIPTALLSLTTLLLDRNNLTELSAPLFLCDKLENLSVQYNQLQSVPPLIAKLNKLRALYIGGNSVSRLPEDMCAITSLRHVVVKETKLHELPTNFDRLQRLSVVDIDNTELDPQYAYALKNGGIPGLFALLKLKKNLVESSSPRGTVYPPGMEPSDDQDGFSDRGSSIYDSEDDSASDNEILDDHSRTNGRYVTLPVLRSSQVTDDGTGTVSARKHRKDIDTMYPIDEPLSSQGHISTPVGQVFNVPDDKPSDELELTVGKNRGQSMLISKETSNTSFMNAVRSFPDDPMESVKPTVAVKPSIAKPLYAPKPTFNKRDKPAVRLSSASNVKKVPPPVSIKPKLM